MSKDVVNLKELAYPSKKRQLLDEVVCPHCWRTFRYYEALWIAESPSLGDDAKVANERMRFLPTFFNKDGVAVDAGGNECRFKACPHCHLRIPDPAFESRLVFFSIVGAPGSGKSYYLSSSTHKLRDLMPKDFHITYTDSDSVMNRVVRDYERLQFRSEKNKIVKIDKTDVTGGDLYNTVRMNDYDVQYPQPFMFSAIPTDAHLLKEKRAETARTVCLYDNSGESYIPKNGDDVQNPLTRHLGQSSVIFFVFDPTQHADFQGRIINRTSGEALYDRNTETTQETVLQEMITRARSYRRLGATEKTDCPLVVIVVKYDAWKDNLDSQQFQELICEHSYRGSRFKALNVPCVERVSNQTRDFLNQKSHEFVSLAESFSKEVVYIPVSATGCAPEEDPDQPGHYGFRSEAMTPINCEIPMLYALTRTTSLIPSKKKQ